jgi:hypothetical protein
MNKEIIKKHNIRRQVTGVLFLALVYCLSAGTVQAGDTLTFSWRANSDEDNTIGYKLYYGKTSRKITLQYCDNFHYDYYIDFGKMERCRITSDGEDCSSLASDEVNCANLQGEDPQCTVKGMSEQRYFALTAYNAELESDYSRELFSGPPTQTVIRVISELLLEEES